MTVCELSVERLHHVLAGVAAVVVRRAFQLVLHLRVEQDELVAFRLPGEVFKLTAAAVETHELAFLSEDRGKLIHDAAVHTDILVLGSLACQSEIPFRNLVVAEEIVECESEAALQGSTGRHAGT